MRLAGKVAIISGAASGMGAATAHMFAREGAKVVIADVLEHEGRQVADAVGASARFEPLDVTKEESWAAVVAATTRHFGKLDVLVNNAGISGSAEQDFYSTEAWHRIMAVNPTGVFFLIKYAIPAMVANGGGSIVNLSSIAGIIGSEHVHMASKTVVRLMTKSVAVQHIRAWLFTIMLNQYANMVRRASREQATVDIEQMSSALVATTDPTASRQLRELERALGRLPGQHGHKPGVFRGTGGSNPVPSSGESSKLGGRWL